MSQILAVDKDHAMKIFNHEKTIKENNITSLIISHEEDNSFSLMNYEHIFDGNFICAERSYLDDPENSNLPYLQVIPYIVITNDIGEVLLYTRNGTEKRLDQKYSIGFGGHVDIPDIKDENNLSSKQLTDINLYLMREARREILEELGNANLYTTSLAEYCCPHFIPYAGGFIYNDSDDVNKVHLGLVQIFHIDREKINLNIGNDDECKNIQWHRYDILDKDIIDRLEPWSKTVLDFIINDHNLIYTYSLNDKYSLLQDFYNNTILYPKRYQTIDDKIIDIIIRPKEIVVSSTIQKKDSDTKEIVYEDYEKTFTNILSSSEDIRELLLYLTHNETSYNKEQNTTAISTLKIQKEKSFNIRIHNPYDKPNLPVIKFCVADIELHNGIRFVQLIDTLHELTERHQYFSKVYVNRVLPKTNSKNICYNQYLNCYIAESFNQFSDIIQKNDNMNKFIIKNENNEYFYHANFTVNIKMYDDISNNTHLVSRNELDPNIPGYGDVLMEVTNINIRMYNDYIYMLQQAVDKIYESCLSYIYYSGDNKCTFVLEHPTITPLIIVLHDYMLTIKMRATIKDVIYTILSNYYGGNINNLSRCNNVPKAVINNSINSFEKYKIYTAVR